MDADSDFYKIRSVGMKRDIEKQKKAMRLLAASNSMSAVQDVANRMNVHRTTIWRWYNAPGMSQYYMDCVREEAEKSYIAYQKQRYAAKC